MKIGLGVVTRDHDGTNLLLESLLPRNPNVNAQSSNEAQMTNIKWFDIQSFDIDLTFEH
jgi:hypothetical protein